MTSRRCLVSSSSSGLTIFSSLSQRRIGISGLGDSSGILFVRFVDTDDHASGLCDGSNAVVRGAGSPVFRCKKKSLTNRSDATEKHEGDETVQSKERVVAL